jgi:parallel beta-helix repeat protein
VTFGHSGSAGNPIILAGAAPGVTLTSSSTGIDLSGRRWITIRGIVVKGTGSYGIVARSGSHITIRNMRVTDAGSPSPGETRSGISFGGTHSLITGVTSDHNSDAGIYLRSGAARVVVRQSIAFANARGHVRAAPGIDVRGVGNVIRGNILHDNEDSGIQLYNGANGTLVAANVVYDNGDHGIDILDSKAATVVSNTVVRNFTSGINVEGGSTNTTVVNNISVDNALSNPVGQKGNISVDRDSILGTDVDYDVLFLSAPGTMAKWSGRSYDSLADFAGATGQEAHGLQEQPRWVRPAQGNFHLVSGSPGIDSANSGAPDQPRKDIAGSVRVDDPATQNTGAGPRGFDDRGAYEFQPPSS